MRPVWLIEAGVFGADAERLMAEVRRQGMAAEAVPFEMPSRRQELLQTESEYDARDAKAVNVK